MVLEVPAMALEDVLRPTRVEEFGLEPQNDPEMNHAIPADADVSLGDIGIVFGRAVEANDAVHLPAGSAWDQGPAPNQHEGNSGDLR